MPYPVHQADINFLEWSSLLAVRDEVVAALVDTADVAGGETASPKPLGLAQIVMPRAPSRVRFLAIARLGRAVPAAVRPARSAGGP